MFSHTPHLVISQQPPLQNDTAWSSITIYKLVSLLPFPLVTVISLPLNWAWWYTIVILHSAEGQERSLTPGMPHQIENTFPKM